MPAKIPSPVNEPNKTYLPGSPERAELKARLASMAGEKVDIPVIVGGIVPNHDVDELRGAGVAQVITPGATADEVVAAVRAAIDGDG